MRAKGRRIGYVVTQFTTVGEGGCAECASSPQGSEESGEMQKAPTMARCVLALLGALLITSGTRAQADVAPFDLAGPHLSVTVMRGGQSLPIAQVPNLAAGDRIWIKADLPATQSVHYLLVAAFLRGATNPPPPSWFFRCETWRAPCARDGLSISVPQDAQQVLLFLAPETGGDFRTLMDAVRGRPGAFVRTSQDLNQATLDRSRLTAYLTAVRTLSESDPLRLKDAAPLLARSLAIRVDEKCLDRIPELQAPCLMQGQESLILNDGHSTSIVEALTSGPASDLAMEASYTPQLSYGYYSPYVASVLDVARIFESFRTAQYQYIPALATLDGEQMALALNAAPSFHSPKSVLVTSLPAVEAARPPPLHAVSPHDLYCARKSALVLPVEGAPLVFSTRYAHDIRLALAASDGRAIELPATADPERGGFVIDTAALGKVSLGESVKGALHGAWGFERYEGPSFQLVNAHAQQWTLAESDGGSLIVGRETTVHMTAASVSCIDGLMLRDPAGKQLKAEWKAIHPNELEVKLPLQDMHPGPLTLLVTQYGATDAESVPLHAFAEAGRFERFTLHADDTQGILRGSRLDEVQSVSVKGVGFVPVALNTRDGVDELALQAQDPTTAATLTAVSPATARVLLKDGRTFDLGTAVLAPRPSARLLGKSVQLAASSADSNIELGNQDELPQDAQLTFSVRALQPSTFSRAEKIEVATADESASVTLGLGSGVTLENTQVAVATLDPAKAFGGSAFGPLRFRVVTDGAAGDWQPLATLVRLPVLRQLQCPSTAELACKLTGSNLFLVDSVSADRDFTHAVQVPDGFPGYSIPVPHPAEGELYVRLRDDPAIINQAMLGAEVLPPSTQEAALAVARHAAASPLPASAVRTAPVEPAATPATAPVAPAAAAPSAGVATSRGSVSGPNGVAAPVSPAGATAPLGAIAPTQASAGAPPQS
jgi:hypothetical protein